MKSYWLMPVVFAMSLFAFIQSASSQETSLFKRSTGSALELPDLSITGDLVGYFNDNEGDENSDKNKFVARSAELSLGGYLYPSIRGDVVMAVHRHDGEYEWHLEEVYVNFLDTIVPSVGLIAGKKLLNIGKINPVHPHHWDYIDTPSVYSEYFGEHGLAGQGAQLNLLVPLPFFLQLEGGYWNMATEIHEHEEDEEFEERSAKDNHGHETASLGVFDDAATARIWASFPVTNQGEFQLGFNGIWGKGPHFEEHKDDVTVYGYDIVYRHSFSSYTKLLFQSETYRMERKIPVGAFNRTGTYVFGKLQINRRWDAGIRYDWVERPVFDEDLPVETDRLASLIVTRNLTETTRLRAQYEYDFENDYNNLMIQLVFGIGPHSHPLQ